MSATAEFVAEIFVRVEALPARTVPHWRVLRREFSRRIAKAPAPEVVALAAKIMKRPGIEFRIIAYELVHHHREALRSLGAKELERFGHGLDSWAAVDTFACYVAGPAWRERQVPDSWMQRWARSPDRWRRRAALVCTVPLNNRARGGCGDTARTLDICRRLVADRDDMVVKGLSWALRELAKRDPVAARAFVSEHRDVLAPRVLREVGNKLRTGLKNPRLG